MEWEFQSLVFIYLFLKVVRYGDTIWTDISSENERTNNKVYQFPNISKHFKKENEGYLPLASIFTFYVQRTKWRTKLH